MRRYASQTSLARAIKRAPHKGLPEQKKAQCRTINVVQSRTSQSRYIAHAIPDPVESRCTVMRFAAHVEDFE